MELFEAERGKRFVVIERKMQYASLSKGGLLGIFRRR